MNSEYNIINASIYLLSSGVGYISLDSVQGVTIMQDSKYNYVITTQEIIANHNYSFISGGSN